MGNEKGVEGDMGRVGEMGKETGKRDVLFISRILVEPWIPTVRIMYSTRSGKRSDGSLSIVEILLRKRKRGGGSRSLKWRCLSLPWRYSPMESETLTARIVSVISSMDNYGNT